MDAPDISVTVDGLKFLNPFIVGSGPPGTNRATIKKAFGEGWGGVVAKTISLNHEVVHNVTPRYAKLYSRVHKEVIGFQNIELISDRPLEKWLEDFKALKAEFPAQILVASVMEEYKRDSWQKLVQLCDRAGVDSFELNFSCPHGLPQRKMGSAMGQDPSIVKEVTGWVREATTKSVWAKLTPNVTDITLAARGALEAGANGVSLINTLLGIIGIDLKTLRPLPTVNGLSTAGGYSATAVRPIGLRMVSEISRALVQHKFETRSISAIGGVERSSDAIEYLLLGANTVQACTAPMLQGFSMIHELKQGLIDFMVQHGFKTIDDFRGKSMQYLTTFSGLSDTEKKSYQDDEWDGDSLPKQTESKT